VLYGCPENQACFAAYRLHPSWQIEFCSFHAGYSVTPLYSIAEHTSSVSRIIDFTTLPSHLQIASTIPHSVLVLVISHFLFGSHHFTLASPPIQRLDGNSNTSSPQTTVSQNPTLSSASQPLDNTSVTVAQPSATETAMSTNIHNGAMSTTTTAIIAVIVIAAVLSIVAGFVLVSHHPTSTSSPHPLFLSVHSTMSNVLTTTTGYENSERIYKHGGNEDPHSFGFIIVLNLHPQ
jgi:hypothetical protein